MCPTANGNRTFTIGCRFCSYRYCIRTFCPGADTSSQSVIAYRSCIVVVGIGGGIHGIHAVIMDAAATLIGQRSHLRGMGEFPHPVPSPQHHIFRFAVHPGIAGFGVFLDGRDLVVLSDDQVALRIISGVGIASLGRGLRLVFDIHRLVGRGIACIGGSCRNQRDRRESQPQGQG